MKAEDLMIGDLVRYGSPVIVTEIMLRDRYAVIGINKHGEHEQVLDNELSPIPLTPEILEKNGFVYNAIPFVDGWEQFGLTLYRGGNGYRIDCGINVSLIIDCVHELQHALRLCGIEKEIIL